MRQWTEEQKQRVIAAAREGIENRRKKLAEKNRRPQVEAPPEGGFEELDLDDVQSAFE